MNINIKRLKISKHNNTARNCGRENQDRVRITEYDSLETVHKRKNKQKRERLKIPPHKKRDIVTECTYPIYLSMRALENNIAVGFATFRPAMLFPVLRVA